MMYEISLLELVATQHLDNVVIQRAPCYTKDLCLGGGTMNTFYKTFFALLSYISVNKDLLVYFRQSPHDLYWTPLDINRHSRSSAQYAAIQVRDKVCFSDVIIRSCQRCFHNSVSPKTAKRFRDELKNLLGKKLNNTEKRIVQTYDEKLDLRELPFLRITYGHRGVFHYRELYNHENLMKNLTSAIKRFYPDTKFIFSSDSSPARYFTIREEAERSLRGGAKKGCMVLMSSVDTSNFTDSFEQIFIAQTTDIMISTHGAFESNLVYMRKGKVWVEITGRPLTRESADFGFLAKAFGVTHQSFLANDLTDRKQNTYSISPVEEKAITAYIIASLRHNSAYNNAKLLV